MQSSCFICSDFKRISIFYLKIRITTFTLHETTKVKTYSCRSIENILLKKEMKSNRF